MNAPLKKAKTGESIVMVREKTLPQPQTSSQCEKPLQLNTRHKTNTMKEQYEPWVRMLAQGIPWYTLHCTVLRQS